MPQKNREPRKPVQIGVRLKDDAGWSDAEILNLSSRGIMARCADPPKRGTYIEIRRGTYAMVARVAWTAPDRFGAHVRERIELSDLLRPAEPGRRRPRGTHCQVRVSTRRRPTVAEREQGSARFARAFDFVTIAAFVTGLAVIGSGLARSALAEPLDEIERAMSGRSGTG